eukprot:9501916-Pyramimonas_sp.AAC.1
MNVKVHGMSTRLTVGIALVILAQSALAQSALAEDTPVTEGLPDLSKLASGISVRLCLNDLPALREGQPPP